jgi:hypothetical protein
LPFSVLSQQQQCEVCGSAANSRQSGFYLVVDCSRCGDFQMGREAWYDWSHATLDDKRRPLASHLIRKMQGAKRPFLDPPFFASLSKRTLPTATDMSDNLLLTIAERVDGRPGKPISLPDSDLSLAASIGAVDAEDVRWAVRDLVEQNLIKGHWGTHFANGWLTALGWKRIEELQRAHVASRYAFFARKFANEDLDIIVSGKPLPTPGSNCARSRKRLDTSTR